MFWALEENYFKWLCAKIMYVPNPTPSLTHWKLLRILHSTEFVWLLSGDDNRAADGIDLRNDFMFESRSPIPRSDVRSFAPCSVFEMLIAFSKRAEFMTDVRANIWFWEFLTNLDLIRFTDAEDIDPADTEEILDKFIWRTYDRNGRGGIFPIANTRSDQRDIELWYQFCDYLVDQNRMP